MYAKKNFIKLLAVVVCVALLVGGVIGGTLAYLISATDPVTNTFAVGNIQITLDENDTKDIVYKVVPGASQDKKPVVTVLETSEKCYVYVCVENNLVINDTPVATLDIDTTKWQSVGTNGNKTIYRYIGGDGKVDAASAKVELPVFTKVTYSTTAITEGNIAQLKDKTIVVDAYAHQSENWGSEMTLATLDSAAVAHFTTTP